MHRWLDGSLTQTLSEDGKTGKFPVAALLVELGFSVAGLGGNNGWGYNHSNESEGDEQIMHWG
jgi:hypothetical protein